MTKIADQDLYNLKYPVGPFKRPDQITPALVDEWIGDIEIFPSQVVETTKNLNAEELFWRYRPDGWNVAQVVHHCVDSHLNSYLRFKLALTEDTPTIKPYFEDRWAELKDARDEDISDSLLLLKGLHGRWVKMLRNMSFDQWSLAFNHPETGRKMTLGSNLSLYSWHCRHHLAHIIQALEAKGAYN